MRPLFCLRSSGIHSDYPVVLVRIEKEYPVVDAWFVLQSFPHLRVKSEKSDSVKWRIMQQGFIAIEAHKVELSQGVVTPKVLG